MSLGEFHHAEEKETTGHKITAWIVIAVIIGGLGVYVVESGMLNPPPQEKSFPRGL
jgi:hypothetical protein